MKLFFFAAAFMIATNVATSAIAVGIVNVECTIVSTSPLCIEVRELNFGQRGSVMDTVTTTYWFRTGRKLNASDVGQTFVATKLIPDMGVGYETIRGDGIAYEAKWHSGPGIGLLAIPFSILRILFTPPYPVIWLLVIASLCGFVWRKFRRTQIATVVDSSAN